MKSPDTKTRPRAGRFITFPESIDRWIDSKITAGTYRTAAEFIVKITRDAYEQEEQALQREQEQVA